MFDASTVNGMGQLPDTNLYHYHTNILLCGNEKGIEE
jgi:hypothetical protein